jgi:hypothetical protein
VFFLDVFFSFFQRGEGEFFESFNSSKQTERRELGFLSRATFKERERGDVEGRARAREKKTSSLSKQQKSRVFFPPHPTGSLNARSLARKEKKCFCFDSEKAFFVSNAKKRRKRKAVFLSSRSLSRFSLAGKGRVGKEGTKIRSLLPLDAVQMEDVAAVAPGDRQAVFFPEKEYV